MAKVHLVDFISRRCRLVMARSDFHDVDDRRRQDAERRAKVAERNRARRDGLPTIIAQEVLRGV